MKRYSEWRLEEVFLEILQNKYKSLDDIPRFNLNSLSSLERPLDEEKLVERLQMLVDVYGDNNNTITGYNKAYSYTSEFIVGAASYNFLYKQVSMYIFSRRTGWKLWKWHCGLFGNY